MERSAWIRGIAPGVVALLAVGLLTSTTLGAPDHPRAVEACTGTGRRVDLPSQAARGFATTSSPAAWFRLDAVLDANGALASQRLVVGRGRTGDRRVLGMDSESFAAGPFGSLVLAGTDDGSGSRLIALDVEAGCFTTIDTSTDIVRRATVAPDGRTVLESRLDRKTRADLGLWIKPLGRDGEATRVVPPIGADARFGRTWSTDLAWSPDGAELAIQSCGEVACRTRVFTPKTGQVRLVDDPELGQTIGLADGRLVAYLACRGLPCPVVAVTIADGRRQLLSAEAGPARVIATDSGPRLVTQHRTDTGWVLSSTTLDGTRDLDLGILPDGFDLAMGEAWSGNGAIVPDGWVLVAPDGRLPLDDRAPAPFFRRVLDGQTSAFDEVIP